MLCKLFMIALAAALSIESELELAIIAASDPIIATMINNSMSVKPFLAFLMIFSSFNFFTVNPLECRTF